MSENHTLAPTAATHSQANPSTSKDPPNGSIESGSDQAELDGGAPGASQLDDADKLHPLAIRLAASHRISSRPRYRLLLLDRLQKRASLLRDAYDHFSQMPDAQRAPSYTAEWLLDNFYIVQQALRQVREDMPPGFYRQLPKLDISPLEGSTALPPSLENYPRAYAVAREIIGHCECHPDLDQVTHFVHAYQQVTPLTMGELWAIPTMLRLGILEYLAQAVARVTGLQKRSDLDEEPPALAPLPPDLTDDAIVANCILSLRMLATQDWKAFFESVSRVEEALRCDPANVYAHMDFDTRDRYRKIVEEMALATNQEEEKVAWEAIGLAQENLTPEMMDFSLWGTSPASTPGASSPGTRSTSYDDEQVFLNSSPQDSENQHEETHWKGLDLPRSTHVGFYLLDAGRAQLEAHLGYSPPVGVRLRRWLVDDHPTLVYLGSIGMLTLAILLGLVSYTFVTGGTLAQLIGVGMLTLLPATIVAVSVVNRLITHTLPPRILPKMDFQQGIPAEYATLVVVPSLLTNADEVQSLLRQLELYFLGNTDPHLRLALLTDFADAPQKHMPSDDALLEQIQAGIHKLNQEYRQRTTGPFYLFHRDREWNPAENCWMGWERKRGKLIELNRLLGGRETSYNVQIGNLDALSEIRYVITLDADTILPRDAAGRLIATMAHPLNRAEFDPESGAVVAGYTVLQPRVEIQPTSAAQSPFARIFAGDTGLDLYTLAVSDVYQDLFGEGSYVGKGIYDVVPFERSLAGRVPENSLLSHDLFEGIHGRAGLLTDVVLYENYPSHYLAYTHRVHRWVRGDWQLLPWLLPNIPYTGGDGSKIPNDLSTLDRWKILDNIRRSLVTPAIIALLTAGWLWLPSPWVWTLVGVLVLAVPASTGIVTTLIQGLRQGSLADTVQSLKIDTLRWLLALTFLPYESMIILDAIATTLVRLTITRKRLLQWTTAAHTIRLFGRETKLGLLWRNMGSVPLLSLALGGLVGLANPTALLVATPLLFMWVISPYVAHRVSRPTTREIAPLSAEQRQQLRRLARRTWLYFERFIGPDDHWLPPDHFQEDPRGLVAHRTSPTNMGLLLLSTLAAYDMGYIGSMDLALRLRLTLESMKSLAWHRGHFLNWYDTRDLKPLLPRYVSTVDSGNLAGCLLVLRQGLQDLLHAPVLRWERLQGVFDTIGVLTEIVNSLESTIPETAVTPLQTHLDHIQQRILAVQDSPNDWVPLLTWLETDGWSELERLLLSLVTSDSHTLNAATLRDLQVWSEQVRAQWVGVRSELELLLPWLVPLQTNQAPSLFTQPNTDPTIADTWQALVDGLCATSRLDEVPGICRAGRTQLSQLQ
ncbi:MAG: hypothetical protein V3S14_17270, partial [Anaerolineae bacterium]